MQEVRLYNPPASPLLLCNLTVSARRSRDISLRLLLPPGKELDTIELLRPLDAGTYEGAFIRYSCLSLAWYDVSKRRRRRLNIGGQIRCAKTYQLLSLLVVLLCCTFPVSAFAAGDTSGETQISVTFSGLGDGMDSPDVTGPTSTGGNYEINIPGNHIGSIK